MTLKDLQGNFTGMTRGIAHAIEQDEGKTRAYIMACLSRFWAGDFGEICKEDTAANLEELEAGEGRCLARYAAAEKLEEDIYIIAAFSVSMPESLDANNTMIMYCGEY